MKSQIRNPNFDYWLKYGLLLAWYCLVDILSMNLEQSICGHGNQLTMKNFHKRGIINFEDFILGLPFDDENYVSIFLIGNLFNLE